MKFIALFAVAFLLGCATAQTVYSVTGYVGSALDGALISNASVTYVGPNGTATVWTDVTGYYTIDVLMGTHNVTVMAAGYITISKDVNVTGTIFSGGDADFYLPPTLAFTDSYRILLTWGATPSDLDSYTYTPWGCVVSYSNRQCVNGTTEVELDRDDTSGWGPETTTWYNMTVYGRYEFWVHRYSSGPFTPAGQPRAQADVYTTSGGLVEVIRIPPTVDDTLEWWRVFRVDACASGPTMTIANSTNTTSPADFPWTDVDVCVPAEGSSPASTIVLSLLALLAAVFAF
jgi:adhesin/invasin